MSCSRIFRYPGIMFLIGYLGLCSGCAFSNAAKGFKAWDEERYDEALQYFETAAQSGEEKTSAIMAGLLYSNDGLIPQDSEKARHYLEIARRSGGAWDQQLDYYLPLLEASIALYDTDISNNEAAVKLLRQQRYRENSHAIYLLGMAYAGGIGASIDLKLSKILFEHGVRTDSEFLSHTYAWVLVTHPDERYRDSSRALQLMKSLMEEDDKYLESPFFLDTLAAVYAEMVEFEKAMEYQSKAIARVQEKGSEKSYYQKWLPAFQTRLDMYKRSEPWRIPINVEPSCVGGLSRRACLS